MKPDLRVLLQQLVGPKSLTERGQKLPRARLVGNAIVYLAVLIALVWMRYRPESVLAAALLILGLLIGWGLIEDRLWTDDATREKRRKENLSLRGWLRWAGAMSVFPLLRWWINEPMSVQQLLIYIGMFALVTLIVKAFARAVPRDD
jgi:UDP-N-acetylmuramyl pentapeptide phosphotransferase/UDP-N-acetylglucosamine-1-phosphate transferase